MRAVALREVWNSAIGAACAGALLILVVSLASPAIWQPIISPSSVYAQCVEASQMAAVAETDQSTDDQLQRIEQHLERVQAIKETKASTFHCLFDPLRSSMHLFALASHLDSAPFGMIAIYALLLAVFACGVFGLLQMRWMLTSFSSYALPYIGVAGTLMSFMIFAAAQRGEAVDIRGAFVDSLSFAAFTTIYGLFGSLILEAALSAWGPKEG